MADNVALPPATGKAACDEVTYSGDTDAQVQLVKLVAVSGSEGSKTVSDGGMVQGTVAAGATDAGNPIGVGLKAVALGSSPPTVAAGQRSAAISTLFGAQYVIAGHPNLQTIKHATITTAVTDVAIVTVGTGSRIIPTALMVTLDNASTVFPSVLIGFGATNTPTTTGVLAAHGGVPAGGGFTRGDGSGMLGIGGDGEDLRITTTGNATGNGLQVVVTYFTVPS